MKLARLLHQFANFVTLVGTPDLLLRYAPHIVRGFPFMDAAERYRRSARRCLAMAEVAADPSMRAAYIQMAQQWHKLAEIVEHMSEHMGPTPNSDDSQRIATKMNPDENGNQTTSESERGSES